MPKRRDDREGLEGKSNEDLWAKWLDHAYELALDVLQRRLNPLLLRFARFKMGALDVAEDVVAVTWARLLKHAEKPRNFGDYAHKVVRNVCNEMRSKANRRRELEDERQADLPGPQPPDEDLPWLNEPDHDDIIVEWLAGLNEYEHGIVHATYYEGHTLQRIADDNSTNVSKINRDLKRLRADLKVLLEKD